MEGGKPKYWTLPALDPFGVGQARRELRLAQAHVDGLTRHGLKSRFYRLLLVREVLTNPRVVFQGWEREGFEQALCYVGSPSKDLRSESIETPPPPGMVFLVFVTPQGTLSDWRWEKSAEDNPEFPENYRVRFRRIVWPTKVTLSALT